MTSIEKSPVVEQESSDDTVSHAEISPALQHKDYAPIQRRIDWRLLPALGLIYGISLMNRKNTANAAVAGMLVDLEIETGSGYNIITLSFFISNVLAQPVMAVLCRKFGARLFLSAICMAWGAVVIGLGFSPTWVVMVPLRLLLGLLESGFGPSALYLLSTWYTRFEIGRRYSIFYMAGCILAALSGVLAYGLMQLDGREGIAGWRWIFILEGVITCAVGLLSYALLVKFPDEEVKNPTPLFLKPDQVRAVIQRLDADRGDVDTEPFKLKAFLMPAKNVEVWVFAFAFFLSTTLSYSFAFFLPIVLRQSLGFSVVMAQCLGTPPYLFASLYMFVGSWLGDRYRKRALIIQINSLVSMIGLPIMGFHPSPPIRYFGIFIAVAGVNANVPALMAWQANNVRGQWQRAFSSTSLSIFCSFGGIAGSLLFRSQDAPEFYPGLIACLTCAVLLSFLTFGLSIYFKHCNDRADRGEMIIYDSVDFRFTI